ncbi:MAG: metallophosphoesterase [Thermoguttaceae bacterium]|nr:metallophosphoesterase [Thermoguttaceae bacterium]
MSRYRRENLETRVERERSEIFAALQRLDRRSFLKVAAASWAAATAAGATFGSGAFQTLRFVNAQENDAASNGLSVANKTNVASDANEATQGVRVAYISDSHLYVKEKNDRFANALVRAVADVNALSEKPDFVIYGGDLAQLGSPEELRLGRDILSDLDAPLKIIVGEHDWYLDLGDGWRSLFGEPFWAFDCKGVRFVGIMSVLEDDFWTPRRMSPVERMKTVAGLDNGVQNRFKIGASGLRWLEETLADCPNDKPVVVFSHSPLYTLYRNWNFGNEDAAEARRILSRFDAATVVHGHTHQLLTHKEGNIAFHGMLSTAWPWPYPPTGVPELTVQMNRPDPFNPNDACGDGELRISPDGLVDKIYRFWNREPILVPAAYVAGDATKRPKRPNLPSY